MGLDTRQKIIAATDAGAVLARDAILIRGSFDPLLARHARRLEELAGGKEVVILLTSPEDAILDSRSRAELLAGLAVVRHVVLPGCTTDREVIDLAGEDAASRADLIRHVHARHEGA
jgi:hypothetical protein